MTVSKTDLRQTHQLKSAMKMLVSGLTVTLVLTSCSPGDSSLLEESATVVEVSDVRECGGDYEGQWYWAPCFSVELEPWTKIKCSIDALDSGGQIVATMSGTFNTLNDGTVTGYGDGVGTQDVPEATYKSIESLDVACDLL